MPPQSALLTSSPRTCVLAIIITYNGKQWLDLCLGSLAGSSTPVDIAVVDNASQDGTQAVLRSKYADAITHLHCLQDNVGFGRAHNHVFAQPYVAQYDYILLLNQDAAVAPEALQYLLTSASLPNVGIVSPLHYGDADGAKLDVNFEDYYVSRAVERAGLPEYIREVSFVNAAVWLIPTAVVGALGGFNPLFSHYGEDTNFVHRMLALDKRVLVDRRARAYHLRKQIPRSEQSLTADKVYIMALVHLANVNVTWRESVTGALRYIMRKVRGAVNAGNYQLAFRLSTVVPKLIGQLSRARRSRNVRLPPGTCTEVTR